MLTRLSIWTFFIGCYGVLLWNAARLGAAYMEGLLP